MPPEWMDPTVDPTTGEQMGPQVPPHLLPNSFDNHEAHILHHNNFRKSQEFASASPTTKKLFEYHVTLHMQALMGVAPTATSGGTTPQPMPSEQGMAAEEAPPAAGGETATPSETQPPGQGN